MFYKGKVSILIAALVISADSLWAASPVVTSSPVTQAVVNQEYSYILTATDADADVLTWAVKAGSVLPAWLSLAPEEYYEENATTVPLTALNRPDGVSFDSAGNMYVADTSNWRILKLAPGSSTGVVVGGGACADSNLTNLRFPSTAKVDSSGNLYITDSRHNRIVKWAPGAVQCEVVAGDANGTAGVTLDKLNVPTSMDFDGAGNIYITDRNNSRVVKWAPGATEGVVVAGDENGTAGATLDKLDHPDGIVVDGDTLYISDRNNSRVVRWDANATEGVVVAGQTGTAGDAPDQLNTPFAIAMDGMKNLYIADAINHRIVKWTPGATSGMVIAGGDVNGTAANQFDTPNGVAVDSEGNLYVADTHNDRIQKFDITHSALAGTPPASAIGVHDINLTVTDGVDTVEQNFQITVKGTVNPALIMYLLQ